AIRGRRRPEERGKRAGPPGAPRRERPPAREGRLPDRGGWGMLNSLAETVATCTRAVGVSFATLSLSTAARGVSIAALGASIAALGGCGSAAPEGVSPALGQARATFVNGGDDRREYSEPKIGRA